MNTLSKSSSVFAEAKQYIPGGVNSPVRSFRSVGGNPPFITRGEGSKLYDLDGNNYIDYVLSYGPLLLGHAHPVVTEAVQEAAAKGTSFGAPTGAEVALAKLVCELVPSMDMVRMVNSGTEATMSARLLPRPQRCPVSTCRFRRHHLRRARQPRRDQRHGGDHPLRSFQRAARAGKRVCGKRQRDCRRHHGTHPRQHGAGTAERRLLTGHPRIDKEIRGKVIGGGLPVAAYGGKREIMNWVSPVGPMYQAGTLSGNPLAMAAGIAALTYMKENDVCATLTKRNAELTDALKAAADAAGVPVQVPRLGSMFTVFFSEKEVTNYEDATACDLDAFRIYFHSMLEQGIYLPPSQFETNFISLAHSDEDFAKTAAAAKVAFTKVAESK